MKLIEELTRVLDEMGLICEKQTQFKLKISFSTDHGPGNLTAQLFIMAPGLHMVDFKRGQSDFLAFFKVFKAIQDKMATFINSEELTPPPTPEGSEHRGLVLDVEKTAGSADSGTRAAQSPLQLPVLPPAVSSSS